MLAVVGCGNPNRGEDGAGPAVVRALRARGLQGAKLLDAGTDGMAAMFAARGCTRLGLVDACRSGSEPGALFEVPGEMLEARHPPSFNLHDFRWEHALFAGRKMYGADFPRDVTVFLIEAQTLDYGTELSEPVAATVGKVAERIAAWIAQEALA